MLMASACRADDPAERRPSNGDDAHVTIAVQTKNSQFKPIPVTTCNAGAVLESKSPVYTGLKATEVASENHNEKFSTGIDVGSQDITEFTERNGVRLYEADPIIVFEPYEGSLKQIRSEQKNGIKNNKWPGRAKYRYKYYWEKGAFKKNPRTGRYFVEPSKFKVYLSFEIKVPEWRYIKSEISFKDRKYWNKYICSLYAHERQHVEITRRHLLETIEKTLTLKAQSSNQLKTLVSKEWKYRGSELRSKQKYFDEQTDHGRMSKAPR